MKTAHRVLVFAEGRVDSRFNSIGVSSLIKSMKDNYGDFTEIVGLVSTNERGSVRALSRKSGIPFYLVSAGEESIYTKILSRTKPDLCVFCGWDLPVYGIDSSKSIAVFRGHNGGYGDAHQDDSIAYLQGQVIEAMIVVSFVLPGEFKIGPRIIEIKVPITIGKDIQPVNEHAFDGTPEERIVKIIRRSTREYQTQYLHQIIVHVLNRAVKLVEYNTVSGRLVRKVVIPRSYENLVGTN